MSLLSQKYCAHHWPRLAAIGIAPCAVSNLESRYPLRYPPWVDVKYGREIILHPIHWKFGLLHNCWQSPDLRSPTVGTIRVEIEFEFCMSQTKARMSTAAVGDGQTIHVQMDQEYRDVVATMNFENLVVPVVLMMTALWDLPATNPSLDRFDRLLLSSVPACQAMLTWISSMLAFMSTRWPRPLWIPSCLLRKDEDCKNFDVNRWHRTSIAGTCYCSYLMTRMYLRERAPLREREIIYQLS